jgi:hypothetical protein
MPAPVTMTIFLHFTTERERSASERLTLASVAKSPKFNVTVIVVIPRALESGNKWSYEKAKAIMLIHLCLTS